jgi:hypothetical protein
LRNGDRGQTVATQSLAILPQKSLCFFDDFESGPNQWRSDGDWGIVVGTDDGRAITDSPGGSYKDASHYGDSGVFTYTTSITAVVGLTGCANPVLTFAHHYQLADLPSGQDLAFVESSTDGLTWTRLVTYAGDITSHATSSPGGQSTPCAAANGATNAPPVPATPTGEWQNSVWRCERIPLPSAAGQLWLRFSLQVNADHLTSLGWLIDNVQIAATQ